MFKIKNKKAIEKEELMKLLIWIVLFALIIVALWAIFKNIGIA